MGGVWVFGIWGLLKTDGTGCNRVQESWGKRRRRKQLRQQEMRPLEEGRKRKPQSCWKKKSCAAWGLRQSASWTGTSPHVASSSYPSHHPAKQTHNSGGTPLNGRVQPTTRTRRHYRGWSRYKKNQLRHCDCREAKGGCRVHGNFNVGLFIVCVCICVRVVMCAKGEDRL